MFKTQLEKKKKIQKQNDFLKILSAGQTFFVCVMKCTELRESKW